VPNKEGKARRYYKFFQGEDIRIVKAAFDRIAREDERFPTPARCAEVIRQIRAANSVGSAVVKLPCKWCDGDGRVHARDKAGQIWAYRCQCFNAARYNNYPEWFGITHSDKRLLDIGDAQADVTKRPGVYRRGLQDGACDALPDHMRARIEKLVAQAEENEPY